MRTQRQAPGGWETSGSSFLYYQQLETVVLFDIFPHALPTKLPPTLIVNYVESAKYSNND